MKNSKEFIKGIFLGVWFGISGNIMVGYWEGILKTRVENFEDLFDWYSQYPLPYHIWGIVGTVACLFVLVISVYRLREEYSRLNDIMSLFKKIIGIILALISAAVVGIIVQLLIP